MGKTPISANGYKELQQELQNLEHNRKDYLAELVRARELGDLSENAAYRVARQRLSRTDGRIRFLKKAIDSVMVVAAKEGTCGLGSKIDILLNGKPQTITLVGHHEGDPINKKYSINSPLGRLIIGKQTGFKGTLITPSGDVPLEILHV